jgi:membrane protein implicated in regulation of membrane protease activity
MFGVGMESPSHPTSPASHKGRAGLVVAIAVVAILLISLPAYRWFFLISLAIGLAVAGILFLWRTLRPIQEKDVHTNKRPLGLD